jgi:gas vesicle protein
VSPWKVILATMVIFACGVMTGAMVARTAATKGAPAPASAVVPQRMPPGPVLQMQRVDFLKRMDKQLDLSPEEHEQIAKILKASQERTEPLWDQIAPQMKDEVKKVREEIRGALTPEQRIKFAEFLKHNPKANAVPPADSRPSRPVESPAPATNAL